MPCAAHFAYGANQASAFEGGTKLVNASHPSEFHGNCIVFLMFKKSDLARTVFMQLRLMP